MFIGPSGRLIDVSWWLNRDPIGLVGGINLYAYVGNDPLNLTDPSGLYGSPFHFVATLIAEIAHGDILQAPFVAVESMMPDFRNGSQGSNSDATHMHAMAGKTSGKSCGGDGGYESRDQAKAGTQQYVNDQLNQYAQAHKWYEPWSGTSYLGDAYHAVEDSYATGHQYQPWDGGDGPLHIPDLAHLQGDWLPSPSNLGQMQVGAYNVRNGGGLYP